MSSLDIDVYRILETCKMGIELKPHAERAYGEIFLTTMRIAYESHLDVNAYRRWMDRNGIDRRMNNDENIQGHSNAPEQLLLDLQEKR